MKAFTAADGAVLSIWRAVGLLRLEPESDGSSAANHEVRRLNDETREEIESRRTDFDTARKQFVDAAHGTAGARID